MSDGPLQPGEFNCRVAFSVLEKQRGPLGEELPAAEVPEGKAWAETVLLSGRKDRTLDQDAVVETCEFTLHPRDVDLDWKITTSDRVYTVRSVDRSQLDRIVITAEADARHDRAGS
mgnify:CR=1 FL=1